RPPEFEAMRLPGATARVAMDMAIKSFRLAGKATAHDEVVALALAGVLSGGDTDITEALSEEEMSVLERDAFLPLVKTTRTLDRLEHMLETGKPLRN
ncbi:MAG: 3-hydroxyacyl-CoA dehydrogenase, partial [Gammaproteobacteria bacterium]|nr:3-hydroxyacyl-CoA dehydrogenase [Gammaproteobacteria bacterium]